MVAIIADDFTGAAEVAGICMRQGVSVSFLLDIPEVETLRKIDTDVLVLAEDTRSATLEGAKKMSRLLAENLLAAGVTQVIKKIDSVLRGWILPEMNTIAEVLGKKSLMIEPANTDTHRYISKGLYYVGDTLLSKTSFKDDPEFPAQTSYAKELLIARSGSDASMQTLPFVVPDAIDESDLRACVQICDDNMLAGGSAAFLKAYLEEQIANGIMRASSKPTGSSQVNDSFALKDCLIICGSAHENSRILSESFVQKGFPVIGMPEELCQMGKPRDLAIIAWVNECVEMWEKEHRLLIRVSSKQVDFQSCADRLRYRMTESVYYILQQIHPSQLLIEGGATACGILARLGWSSFKPIKEWIPGVVQLRLENPPYCYITLKPGSYSWPKFEW